MLPWTIIHWTQFTNAISHIVTLNLAVQVTMMQMWTILKTTTMIGSTMIILSMTTMVWNIHMEYEREKGEIMDFRDEFLLISTISNHSLLLQPTKSYDEAS